MNRLPMLTAAAGVATLFGVADARADCQDCVPDEFSSVGGYMCCAAGTSYGACWETVSYDGSGEEIPGSKVCQVSACDNSGSGTVGGPEYGGGEWHEGMDWTRFICDYFDWCPVE